MKTYPEIRTAVVGCGYWGKNLVRNFVARSDLRVCCDLNPENLRRVAVQHPSVRVTPSYAEVLADPEVDAVVISTQATTHAELALAGLEAGKHVFVEKPFALDVTHAERLVEKADQAGRILMVGHLMEYHPAVDVLKGLIDRGELGEIRYASAQRVNSVRLYYDESAIWDLGPHDVSILLYLFGEEASEVHASPQAAHPARAEDVILLRLGFPSGRVAQVQVGWRTEPRTRHLTIVGSRRTVVFDDMEEEDKIRVHDVGIDRAPADWQPYERLVESLLPHGGASTGPLSNQEPLAIECGAFLEAIATGVPPRSDGRDGLRVVQVLSAAERDLQQRDELFSAAARVVVELDQGSTSLLQRRLKVGYSRAARILDQLERAGIVGPPDGPNPREVRISAAELGSLEEEGSQVG